MYTRPASTEQCSRCASFTSRPIPPTPGRTAAFRGSSDSLTRGLARRGHQVTVCTTDACDDVSRRLDGATAPHGRRRRTAHVFPNVSNRLAYHLQLFLPLGLASLSSAHMRAHVRRRAPARLPELARRDRRAPSAPRRRAVRAGAQRHRAADRAAPARQTRRSTSSPGRRVLAGAARVLAVSDAERAQLRALGVDAVGDPRRSRIRSISTSSRRRSRAARSARAARDCRAGRSCCFSASSRRASASTCWCARSRALAAPTRALVIAGNDMGGGAAARSLVRDARPRARGRSSPACCAAASGSKRWPTPTSSSIRRSTRSSGWCRSRRCCAARRSSSPTTQAAARSCARPAAAQVVPLGDVGRAGARDRRACSTIRAAGAQAAVAAATRVRAAYGDDVVCAQIERLYREMVGARVMEGVSFVVPVHNGAALDSRDARVDSSRRPTAGRWRSSSSTIAAATGRRSCCEQLARDLAAADRRGEGARRGGGDQRRRPRGALSRSSARSIRTSCSQPGWMRRARRRRSTIRRSPPRRATTRRDPDARAVRARDGPRPRAAIRGDRRTATRITCAPATRRIAPTRCSASGCSTRRSATATTTT